MSRPASGQVVVDERRRGTTFALRFRAYGKRRYMTLGSSREGWSESKAHDELQNVLADVRRGIWRAAAPEPVPAPTVEPTFHEFATTWFDDSRAEWKLKTRADYEWQLSCHLLPFFASHRVSAITIAEVDRYRRTKLTEAEAVREAQAAGKPLIDSYIDKAGRKHRRARRALSATSINKTITRLAQILELAVEYELIQSNPARGRRRRVKTRRRTPVWIDNAEHIKALLAAAAELDGLGEEDGGQAHKGAPAYRRALLATLLFAGLRIGELTALRWRDIDLAGKRIMVRGSKADDGSSEVELLPVLHDELSEYKANAANTAPDQLVFPSSAGSALGEGNIRNRVLRRSVERANERLIGSGALPLPEGLTPHKLRHTFASLLIVTGVDPGRVMDQLRHADAGFTLRVYRHAMRRDAANREQLMALVNGGPWLADEAAQVCNRTLELAGQGPNGQELHEDLHTIRGES